MKVIKKCTHCGSTDVTRDADAKWDVGSQSWQLYQVNATDFCESCDGETTIVDELVP